MDLTDNTVHPILSMPENTSFAWTLSADRQSIIVYCDKGFIAVDTQKNTCTPLTFPDKLKLEEENIQIMLQPHNGELWIGTSKTLWKLNQQNKWVKLLPEMQSVGVIRQKENGNIYVGSNKGLYIFNQGEEIKHIPFQINATKGLPGTEIRDIYMPDSQTCWIATNDGLVQLTTDKIKIFTHDDYNPHSLIDNNVCTIAQGPDQKLWIATFQGLCLFNPSNEIFTDMTQPGNDCLTSRLTSCITEDLQGNIWIGTTEKGINVLSIEADTIAHYYHQPWNKNSLPGNYVECIFCCHNGNIWVGTHQGLAKFDKEHKQFQRFDSTKNLHVKGIQEDFQHMLWMTTDKGLLLADSTGNIIRKFYDYHGLPNNDLSKAICRLKNEKICIGSNYGFSIFEPKHLKETLPSPKIMLTDIQVNSSPFFIDLNKEKKLELKSEQNSFTIGFAATDYEYSQHLKYRYKLVTFDKKWNYTTPPLLSAKYTSLDFGKYSLEIEVSNSFGEWNRQVFVLPIYIT